MWSRYSMSFFFFMVRRLPRTTRPAAIFPDPTLLRSPRYGVSKQGRWKFHHIGGQREINELHVPLGRDVRLIMSSEDVIHRFAVPAFRVKQDVGRAHV